MYVPDTKVIIVTALSVLLFGLISSYVLNVFGTEPEIPSGSWACTTDVLTCPDGSTVSRIPPYCQFAPCASF